MAAKRLSESAGSLRSELKGLSLAATITTIVMVVVFRLWNAHPRVPFLYSGDGLLTLNGLRNMRLGGWYFTTNNLGFPVGQDLHDFPALGDNLHLAILWLLIKILQSEVLAFNAYFLATYPLVAACAFVGFRIVRVNIFTSVALAVLYAFLPYHFLQGPGHLYLAAYWAVPLAAAFLIRSFAADPVAGFPDMDSSRPLRLWLSSHGAIATVIVAVITASTGFYYGFFLFVLAALAGLVHLVRKEERRFVPATALLAGSSALTLGLQFLPIWLYQLANGSNLGMVARSLAATEFYSLKLVDLVLPMPGHRIHSWAALRETASQVFLTGENSMALGVVGALGFVLILLRPLLPLRDTTSSVGNGLVRFTYLAVALTMVGGIGQLIATFGFTQIRVWSRISVFIAFAALAYVGVLANRVFNSLSRRVAVPALLLVALIGVLDTTRPSMLADYKITARSWELDRDLVMQIENKLGPTANILQLPFVPFPENPPVVGMEDYDHLRGYLHSDGLSWSYGAIKGRVGQDAEFWNPLSSGFLQDFRKNRFDGIWINRRGYSDSAHQVLLELERLGFRKKLEVREVVILALP